MDERKKQQQQGTSSSREQQAAASSSSWTSYSYSSCSFITAWPPRCYPCSFCKREFRSAQALGGHMNVHRRDRARLRHGGASPPPSPPALPPPPIPLPPPPSRAPPPAMTTTMMMIPNLNYPPPQYHSSSSSKKLLDRDGDTKQRQSSIMELELGVVGVVCSNYCSTAAATCTTPAATAPASSGGPEDDLDLELRLGVSSSS